MLYSYYKDSDMMKSSYKYRFLFLFLMILVFCSACDGTVTRNIRKDGFKLSSNFVCNAFYPKNKEDTNYEKIRYFTGTHLINTEGKIYETALSQTYTDGQNCREANTLVRVKAIMDNSVIKGMDDQYYYLASQNNVPSYTQITTE